MKKWLFAIVITVTALLIIIPYNFNKNYFICIKNHYNTITYGDLCRLTEDELKEICPEKEFTKRFNSQKEQEKILTVKQAYKSAMEYAMAFNGEIYKQDNRFDLEYDYCDQKPFQILNNTNAKAWVVHGERERGYTGFVLCVVISKENGEILFGGYI